MIHVTFTQITKHGYHTSLDNVNVMTINSFNKVGTDDICLTENILLCLCSSIQSLILHFQLERGCFMKLYFAQPGWRPRNCTKKVSI